MLNSLATLTMWSLACRNIVRALGAGTTKAAASPGSERPCTFIVQEACDQGTLRKTVAEQVSCCLNVHCRSIRLVLSILLHISTSFQPLSVISSCVTLWGVLQTSEVLQAPESMCGCAGYSVQAQEVHRPAGCQVAARCGQRAAAHA